MKLIRPPITEGPWNAIKGDVLNPDRKWGVSKYLTLEQCQEIDGEDALPNSRSEVIAEVCEGPTDEADAVAISTIPEVMDFLERVHGPVPVELAWHEWSTQLRSEAKSLMLKMGYTEEKEESS